MAAELYNFHIREQFLRWYTQNILFTDNQWYISFLSMTNISYGQFLKCNKTQNYTCDIYAFHSALY